MVDYRKLKRGDVLAITNYNNRLVIVDKIKCDKTYSSPQIYINAEVDNGLYIRFKNDDMCDFYLFEDIIVRYATEDEKNKMYNAIGKHFTEEYDKDWYNHFTDSSYFDIQDYLLDAFCINISEYDDDLIYPDFINEIHNYIWDKLCKAHSEAMGVPNTVENKPEMVNKQEFIEKVCERLKNTIDDDVIVKCGSVVKCINVNEFVEYFRKIMEE